MDMPLVIRHGNRTIHHVFIDVCRWLFYLNAKLIVEFMEFHIARFPLNGDPLLTFLSVFIQAFCSVPRRLQLVESSHAALGSSWARAIEARAGHPSSVDHVDHPLDKCHGLSVFPIGIGHQWNGISIISIKKWCLDSQHHMDEWMTISIHKQTMLRRWPQYC